MEKSMYEKMDVTYSQVGDYLLPDIVLPAQENKPIGVWGQQYLRHIRQHHEILYFSLLTKCELNAHVAEIDRQANEMYLRLTKELAEKEGLTEQLKAEDPMAWVRRMNNIDNQAREIVNAEMIYTL